MILIGFCDFVKVFFGIRPFIDLLVVVLSEVHLRRAANALAGTMGDLHISRLKYDEEGVNQRRSLHRAGLRRTAFRSGDLTRRFSSFSKLRSRLISMYRLPTRCAARALASVLVVERNFLV